MNDERRPSDRARELLRGAYDTHMHISPDVVERIVDDISLARRFQELGMAGFVLKSHYGSTAERASRRAQRPSRASTCSGRSRSTGRSAASTRSRSRSPRARAPGPCGCRPSTRSTSPTSATRRPGAKVPVWVKLQLELREQGIEIPPVPVVDEQTAPSCPKCARCSTMIARHGMVLATGHLSRDEIFAVVEAALESGVETIVITHPEFPSQDLCGRRTSVRWPSAGALLERCFTTPHTGKVTWEQWLENIRAAGPGELGPVDRSGAGVQPAGRGRHGADGRSAARCRLRRGGGVRDGGREHAPGRGG